MLLPHTRLACESGKTHHTRTEGLFPQDSEADPSSHSLQPLRSALARPSEPYPQRRSPDRRTAWPACGPDKLYSKNAGESKPTTYRRSVQSVRGHRRRNRTELISRESKLLLRNQDGPREARHPISSRSSPSNREPSVTKPWQ